MSYLALIIAFIAGAALGGVVFSLVVTSRARARQAELEARAGSAEAVVTELRQQYREAGTKRCGSRLSLTLKERPGCRP